MNENIGSSKNASNGSESEYSPTRSRPPLIGFVATAIFHLPFLAIGIFGVLETGNHLNSLQSYFLLVGILAFVGLTVANLYFATKRYLTARYLREADEVRHQIMLDGTWREYDFKTRSPSRERQS